MPQTKAQYYAMSFAVTAAAVVAVSFLPAAIETMGDNSYLSDLTPKSTLDLFQNSVNAYTTSNGEALRTNANYLRTIGPSLEVAPRKFSVQGPNGAYDVEARSYSPDKGQTYFVGLRDTNSNGEPYWVGFIKPVGSKVSAEDMSTALEKQSAARPKLQVVMTKAANPTNGLGN